MQHRDPQLLDQITLVIPSHNRHRYLDRILHYYKEALFSIVIADSTTVPYPLDEKKENIRYFHMPGNSLTSKLSSILRQVTTPYVFMCADDDFIIPERVAECVAFLNGAPDYMAAQGNSIVYFMDKGHKVTFAPIYTSRLSYEIAAADALERLRLTLQDYRSMFYAVHRLPALQTAFCGAETAISNLYLNEYLTTIPILFGKFKQFSFLYHVREYSAHSDDKTTPNIDRIFVDQVYRDEFSSMIDRVATCAVSSNGGRLHDTRSTIETIFVDFAKQIASMRSASHATADKKFGKFVKLIPLLGDFIISRYRKMKRQRQLKTLVQNEGDKENLHIIKNIIVDYANAVK